MTCAGNPHSTGQTDQGQPRRSVSVVAADRNAQKPILLLAHLDVVAEALRADSGPRDPFILNEENGFFLGRGVADDKSMASIFVANLLGMKSEGIVPDRDIIMALTADEEGGEANGAKWLATEHKDLINAEFALNEGADGALVNAKPVTNGVQAAEKVSVNFTLTATNSGGHSSMPRPDNAIYELSHAMIKISDYHFPIVLNPDHEGVLHASIDRATESGHRHRDESDRRQWQPQRR